MILLLVIVIPFFAFHVHITRSLGTAHCVCPAHKNRLSLIDLFRVLISPEAARIHHTRTSGYESMLEGRL